MKARLGRKVVFFGITLPVWAWLLIPTTVALAWVAVALLFHNSLSATSTAAPAAAEVVAEGAPSCVKLTGTGDIACTASPSGGVDVVITNISDNAAGGNPSTFRVRQFYRNPVGKPAACIDGSFPVTPGLSVTDNGPYYMVAGDGWNFDYILDFGAITPSQTISVPVFDTTAVAGTCP